MTGEQKFFTPPLAEAQPKLGSGTSDFSHLYDDWLNTEEYEVAKESLSEMEAVSAWRERAHQSPFPSFYRLVENARRVRTLGLAPEEQTAMMWEMSLAMEERAQKMSPRVADAYLGLLARFRGEIYTPRFEMTGTEIEKFAESGDLDVFFSSDSDTSWALRLNRIEQRLEGYLRGVRALDRREGNVSVEERVERQKRLEASPTRPPERRNESRPGVDAMERLKEGERAPALWNISPAYGGYFREQSFSQWDENRKVWTEPQYLYTDGVFVAPLETAKQTKERYTITMNATVSANRWVALPMPYTHDIAAVDTNGKVVSVKKDQNGDAVVYVSGNDGESAEVRVILTPVSNKTYAGAPSVPNMRGVFSEETEQEMKRVKTGKRGNIIRASALASYVRKRVRYLAPKDAGEAEHYNQAYRTHESGFAVAVDELRAADCDVANTYFSALCARIDIPVRHVVGHSVKGKDAQTSSSQIHSGTGHAWSEVWDDMAHTWVRIDATPAGDPQLEEEMVKGSTAPGDYGEQEAVGPSDEYLAKVKAELEKKVESLSHTSAERKIAEDTGIELREARAIMKEITATEETRLPNGRRVVDALSQLFDMIVESRQHFTEEYTGPLRKRDGGGRIDDIVAHAIGIRSGESDPLSREKEQEKEEQEKLIGGFDVYLIGDKSGSMSSTVDGEAKWKLQRRALYLILSALHRFEEKLVRSGVQMDKNQSLSVRTESLSFRGDTAEEIDTDKSLSNRFESADKVRLWHSLTGQGGGNGDVTALQMIHHEIVEELKEAEAQGNKEQRLRIVIPMTDGYPDSISGVHQMAEALGKQGAVVIGIGLTETASTVRDIYATPFSHGDYVKDISDLPALVAKYVILEAMKLFPEKAKKESRVLLESIEASFEGISG